MPSGLEDIELDEISGVDDPANQHASVVLVKRFGYTDCVKPKNEAQTAKGDGSVTVEELTQTLESLQTQVFDLTKRAEAAETAVESLTKSAEDAGLQVKDNQIAKRAEPEFVEIAGEKVEKSLVPAPVLKALESAAADIAKMQQKAEEVELAKRGETELPNLAGTALAKGRLLKTLQDQPELIAALKAADAVMKGNYEEKGENVQEDLSSPAHKLEKMARDRAAAAAGQMTFEAAYAEVTQSGEGMALLNQMRSTAN